jgi:formylglycine-generating enzyme required for sulfatase activity
VPVVVEPRQASAPALPEWPRGRAAATAAVLRDLESWEAASSEAREDAAREVARRIPGLAFAGTRWFDSGGRRFEMAILRHDATSIEMSLLPGGTFEMGSPPEEPGRAPAESLRTETVAAFLLARAPVTQAAWEKAMAASPSAHRGPELPVEQVSWLDAQEFCRRTGFSLPTEAQWEYACRAGTRSRFSFGDDEEDLARHAWFEANSGAVTHPAGMLQPNAFGLHDMHGNVWEWCADAWADYDGQRSETEGGAVREESQIRRVVRGGAWTTTPGYLRCAARLPFAAGARRTTIGLRPCLAVPEPAPGRSGSGSAAGGIR